MEACWQVNSENELFATVKTIKANPGFRPYSDKNVQEFLDEAIYNGDSSRNILSDYSKFLYSVADQ